MGKNRQKWSKMMKNDQFWGKIFRVGKIESGAIEKILKSRPPMYARNFDKKKSQVTNYPVAQKRRKKVL